MCFDTTRDIDMVVISMKRQIVTLFLTLLLFISVGGVVSCIVGTASATKQSTDARSSYTTDIPVKDQPTLILLLSNNVTQVNNPVDLYGGLATLNSGKINGIEGATIHIQRLNYDGTSWNSIRDLTTMSGNFSGFFTIKINPQDAGPYIYRVTFDGNSNYEAAISNWVDLRAYS